MAGSEHGAEVAGDARVEADRMETHALLGGFSAGLADVAAAVAAFMASFQRAE